MSMGCVPSSATSQQESGGLTGWATRAGLMVLALAALVVFPVGCTTNPTTGRSQFLTMSREDEIKLGTEAAPGLTNEFGGKVSDGRLQDYVSNIGRQLAAVTEADNPTLPWEFTLLDSGVINAFALPGGKVFIVTDSVYRTIFRDLIPVYEKNVSGGLEWPGWTEDVRKFIPTDRLNPETQPLAMNFLDPHLVRRELETAGLETETAAFFRYTAGPDFARLDGREIVGAVGVKV